MNDGYLWTDTKRFALDLDQSPADIGQTVMDVGAGLDVTFQRYLDRHGYERPSEVTMFGSTAIVINDPCSLRSIGVGLQANPPCEIAWGLSRLLVERWADGQDDTQLREMLIGFVKRHPDWPVSNSLDS